MSDERFIQKKKLKVIYLINYHTGFMRMVGLEENIKQVAGKDLNGN